MIKEIMRCCSRAPWRKSVSLGFGQRRRRSTLSLLPDLELAFNNHISTEFCASFTYLAMGAFFGRQSVSLPGCHKYFTDQALDEWRHGEKFIRYLNRRGNAVTLLPVRPPTNLAWESPSAAFAEALDLERSVTQKIIELLTSCEGMGDKCACNFLESEFLENQEKELDKLSRHLTELEKIGPDGLGIYLFDRDLLKNDE